MGRQKKTSKSTSPLQPDVQDRNYWVARTLESLGEQGKNLNHIAIDSGGMHLHHIEEVLFLGRRIPFVEEIISREAKIPPEGREVLFPPIQHDEPDFWVDGVSHLLAWDLEGVKDDINSLQDVLYGACAKCGNREYYEKSCPTCGGESRYSTEEQKRAIKRARKLFRAIEEPIMVGPETSTGLTKEEITRDYISLHRYFRELKKAYKKFLSQGLSKDDAVSELVNHIYPKPPAEKIRVILDSKKRPRDLAIEELHKTTGLSISTLNKYIRLSRIK